MKVMILAAGYGKRLAPITDTLPKPLIRVGKMSLIDRNINYLVHCGFHEIIINVSHHAEQIINHVNDNFPELNISFSIEDKPLGTGGGVYNALEKIGDNPFLLTNADILHHINLKKLPKDVKAAHLVGINNPNHNPQGDFSIKDNIVKVDEHKNDHTWTGVSIINPAIFKDNQFDESIFNLWDSVLPNYIEQRAVTGEVTTEPWIDVGTHERLKLANSVYNDD